MNETRDILTLAVEIGDAMLQNGGEIYRVEDTVMKIMAAYQLEDYDVYVLSNGIFASANEGKEDACSMIRHVPLGSVNLLKISKLNQLARDICVRYLRLGFVWMPSYITRRIHSGFVSYVPVSDPVVLPFCSERIFWMEPLHLALAFYYNF